jgi:hypothetical protein
MKWVMVVVFIIIYLVISFFGLGPVLLADGSMQERVLTLPVVLLLYVVITIIFRACIKK